jgi:HEAT repeat protein
MNHMRESSGQAPSSPALVLGVSLAILCSAACDRSAPGAPHASGPTASASQAEAALEPIEADDRIAYLLAPCPSAEAFLADTSDMTSVLVAKLATGQRDPLKTAKAELVAIGDAAMPELQAAFDKSFSDPHGEPRLLNILTVASLTASQRGRPILLRGLEHPAESVRTAAARGLQRHPDPADYDRIRALLPISNAEMQTQIARTLAACDRKRLEDDFLSIPPTGHDVPFQKTVVFEISDTRRDDVIDAFVRAYPNAEGEVQAFMAAAAARMGNGEAHAALLAWLKDESPARRQLAVQAMIRAGLVTELAPRLREEEQDLIRESVANGIAGLPPTPETRAWLAGGLSDRARNVRMTCMVALVKLDDDAAVNAALELLKGENADLESGLRVLREAWKENPALAERALAILLRLRAHELEPVRVSTGALDRAIAQVPLEAATRFLYDLARKTPGDVEGIPAHRWYLQQAGNTGSAGWSFLRSRWDEEAEPRRRMDIVMACAYDISSARTRDFLISVAESERATPLEILYAARFLVQRGPAAEIAPLLKRLTLRVQDPDVRRALNCMLWEWYG